MQQSSLNRKASSETETLQKEKSVQKTHNGEILVQIVKNIPAVRRRFVLSLGFLPFFGAEEISTCMAPDITIDGLDGSNVRREYNR